MPFSQDEALRLAIALSNRTVSTDNNPFSQIEALALQKIQGPGISRLMPTPQQTAMQTAAMSAALKGISLAYSHIREQLRNIEDKQRVFELELKGRMASFTVALSAPEKSLSREKKVLNNFLDLANDPQLFCYLGLHKGELKEDKNLLYYSTLPFYSMQANLHETQALEKESSVESFLGVISAKYLDEIEQEFAEIGQFEDFVKTTFTREDYVNVLRARRFIIISLANLLWNLLHPVNPATGYFLDIDECIQACAMAKVFLNTLLNKERKFSLWALKNDSLLHYVRCVELRVHALIDQYEKEKRSCELNMDPLCSNAKRTLKILDSSIFKLIYSYYNPESQKREDLNAAKTLVVSIETLALLLKKEPSLAQAFPIPRNQVIPALNLRTSTIIDVLLIFVHADADTRKKIYENLQTIPSERAKTFSFELLSFYELFIRPVKIVNKKELEVKLYKKKAIDVAVLTGRKLMPLICLLLYNDRAGKFASNQQVKTIISMAQENREYFWSLPLPTHLRKETEVKLINLLQQQFRFSKVKKLLDSVREVVKNYRHLLQDDNFKGFLTTLFKKVRMEFDVLIKCIEEINKALNTDTTKTRGMGSIFDEMIDELKESLQACITAVKRMEMAMIDPEFIEKEKQLLSSRFRDIHAQYLELFTTDDSGITLLINNDRPPLGLDNFSISVEPFEYKHEHKSSGEYKHEHKSSGEFKLEHKSSGNFEQLRGHRRGNSSPRMDEKISLFKTLTKECHSALSAKSKRSKKGQALRELAHSFDHGGLDHTATNLDNAVKKLATEVLVPRKGPCFFPAKSYGKTRSAAPLVNALRNIDRNIKLSLTTNLLGSYENLSDKSDKEIVKRLQEGRDHLEFGSF